MPCGVGASFASRPAVTINFGPMRTGISRKARALALAFTALSVTACGTPTLAVPASPALGVKLRETITAYEVTGTSIPELRASIHSRALLQADRTSFAGYTRWNLGWIYARSTMGPSGCSPNDVVVELELAVRYPAWTDSASASAPMRSEWRRYLSALKAHEANHASIAVLGANRLARELRTMVAPSCGLLQLEGQKRAAAIMNAIREENRRYDETTRHGATEGATLASGP